MQSASDYDITNNVVDIPIVVFDVSGSVAFMTDIDDPVTGKKISVIDKLVDLLKEMSIMKGFNNAHMIVFGNMAKYIGIKTIKNVTSQELWEVDVGELTDMATAFRVIEPGWHDIEDDNVMTVPIYILTDGEVDSSRRVLGDEIIKLSNPALNKIKYDIRMMIFECNDKDYTIDDCTSGNIIVSVIRERTLYAGTIKENEGPCMSEEDANIFIKFIYFFNTRYPYLNDRFVNTYNVVLPDGYVQYDDKCFHFRNYALFLADITKQLGDLRNKLDAADDEEADVDEKEADVDDEDEENNEKPKKSKNCKNYGDYPPGVPIMGKRILIVGQLEKIGFNLIKTIKGLEKIATQNKIKNFNKRLLIDFFCNLIGVDSITDSLKRELIYGVDNATFQEYKTKRAKLFNRTQISMYSNLKACITFGTPYKYTSFIEDGYVYDINTIHVEHSINMGFREYKHAGVFDRSNNKLVPILPAHNSYRRSNWQAIRQWIRAIYSKKYGIPASSDLIHYTFLLDNMYVQASDLPQSMKVDYLELTGVMLDRVRYGEAIKESVYLINNHPKPVGSKEDFWDFIKKCPNYPIGLSEGHLTPQFVWGMVTCMCGRDLFRSQIKYCGKFNGDYEKEYELNKEILSKSPFIPKSRQINIDTFIEPNYYCFVTLADTAETGGYMFYPHESYQKKSSLCTPSYVLSDEAICYYKPLDKLYKNKKSTETPVLRCPHCTRELDIAKMKKIIPKDEYELTDEYIVKNKQNRKIYRSVRIYDEFSDELIELNKLDFSNNYRHRVNFEEHVVLGNMMDSYSVIQFTSTDKQTEFNKKVPQFLFGIDMKNIVIAGGMNRSILLGQKIQDIDVFFVGLNEEQVKLRILKLINDIVTTLQKEDPDYRFIMMYKPLNSVVELLCTRSTFDDSVIADDDDVVIDEKMLFIQNDIVHKVQIILRSHESINEIFDNFDMFGSCVVFDGVKTFFTEASYVAFKYMVNMVDPLKSKHISYNSRILKYYRYGFAIGLSKSNLPKNALEKLERSPKIIKISGCVFETADIDTQPDGDIVNDEFNGFNDLNPTHMKECKTNYVPIESFKLEKKKNIDNNEMNDCYDGTEIQTQLQTQIQPAPMYESYDEVDMNMIGLYNYMTDNKIKFCYLMGKVNEEEISNVFDIRNVEFLKDRRDGTYNWYAPDQISVISKTL